MTTPNIRSSGKKSSSPLSDKSIKSEDGATVKSKMHKRSRSGCFTCRLRRKKCDEGRPVCRACRHLGVECEYKRPTWWQYPERRKQHKEAIKDIISNTKKNEKPSQVVVAQPASIDTPPSLCHSLPQSDAHSDVFSGTRAASVDSHFSPQFDIATPPDIFNSTPMMPPPQWTPMLNSSPGQFSSSYYSPFEVEVKTESHMLVNDMPTQKDSVISTFSAFQQSPPSGDLPTAGMETWMSPEMLENHNEIFREEPLNFEFFDFPHAPFSPTHQAVIGVEDCDKHLLDHFLENISRLVFPILDVNQHSTALNDIILPALESNKCYLHCCLSTAAVHMKAMGQMPEGIDIDTDIMRHRFATISSLCEAFERDSDHSQTLEATLGLILFQTSVGSPNDGLPDIPWHQHFQAAHALIEKLDLMQTNSDVALTPHTQQSVSFNTSLTSWIDILGSTMLSRVPAFADTYRRKIEGGVSSGMAELMGCDDRVMYLISEIACLESLKQEGQLESDIMLCDHIRSLGTALSATEVDAGEVGSVYSATGAIRPKQLSTNITAAFRLAARIHLCSLVPDFAHDQPSIMALVGQLDDVWQHIPSGAAGFDRSLVWPLLIGGCASTEHSAFRQTYYERFASLGPSAMMGSFGRMHELLTVVWDFNDTAYADGERLSIHWRDVMQQRGWDCLLI